jgi:geranylgeranylglycerol-phosphate geranylgeranyltransferase
MAAARDIAALVRPGNGAMAALAVLVGASIPRPIWGYQEFPWPEALLVMASAFCIAGFGNVLDDILDRRVDVRAHPWRPLPSGRVSLRQAARLSLGLLTAGLVFAILAGPKILFFLASVNALALALYAKWLKAVPVAGNLLVAGVVASTFIFGALLTGEWWLRHWWGSLWALAGMAFLVNVARENAKSLEDAPHDADRRTLAQVSPWAARALTWATTLAACLAAAWMVLEPNDPWWMRRPITWDGHGFLGEGVLGWWRFGVAASIPVFLSGAARVVRDPRRSQKALKAAMAVALLGYAWGALGAWQAN